MLACTALRKGVGRLLLDSMLTAAKGRNAGFDGGHLSKGDMHVARRKKKRHTLENALTWLLAVSLLVLLC